MPEEAESLRAWREGKPPPAWQKEREWLAMVREACGAGKSMQRVRVVHRPLSEYVRLEFEWGYPDNVAAGEDIRILELANGETLPHVSGDFWLFDNAVAVGMEYTADGSFIRPVEVSDIEPYRRCRVAIMARAVPFNQYRKGTSLAEAFREQLDDPVVMRNIATIALGRSDPPPRKD